MAKKVLKKEKSWNMTMIEMIIYLSIGAIALFLSGKIETLILLGLIVASDVGILALIYFEWYGVVHRPNVEKDKLEGKEPDTVFDGVKTCLQKKDD